MKQSQLLLFFAFLKLKSVELLSDPIAVPDASVRLQGEELIGLQRYGGFHGKPGVYREFRSLFSAFLPALLDDAQLVRLNRSAYKASLLFGSIDKFWSFYKKIGFDAAKNIFKETPLDSFSRIDFPRDKHFKNVDFVGWGDFLLYHRLSEDAQALFKFHGHRFPAPSTQSNAEGLKGRLIQAEAIGHRLRIACDHPSVTALLNAAARIKDYKNRELRRAANYHFGALGRAAKPMAKQFPDFNISGDEFGIPGGVFKRLSHHDPRMPLVGAFTNSCEHVSDDERHIEGTIKNAFQGQSAFYVVEDAQGEIVAHSWAWRSREGVLVFDGFESFKEKFINDHLLSLMIALRAKMQDRGFNRGAVTGLGIGKSVKHIEEGPWLDVGTIEGRLKLIPSHVANAGSQYYDVHVFCPPAPRY